MSRTLRRHLFDFELQREPTFPSVSLRIDRRIRNVGASLTIVIARHLEATITLRDQLIVKLPVLGESHHEHGCTQRQRVASIGVPGVPRLAVRAGDFLHQLVLGDLWNARRDQLTRSNLMHVAVPQMLFVGRKIREESGGDDVRHP